MNICKHCENAYISSSLSGDHITCKYDKQDYSFTNIAACQRYSGEKYYIITRADDFLTEEDMYV